MLLVFWHMVGETILETILGKPNPDLGGYQRLPFLSISKKYFKCFILETAVPFSNSCYHFFKSLLGHW